MKTRWNLLLAFGLGLTLIVLTGCGTIYSLTAGNDKFRGAGFIYGGFRYETMLAFTGGDNPTPYWLRSLLVLDLPLSACADTITLPYTIYRANNNSRRIYIRSVSNRDGEPRYTIRSDMRTETREEVSLLEVCTVLSSISGRPASVEVNFIGEYETSDDSKTYDSISTKLYLKQYESISVVEFGRIYEAISANRTLTLSYNHPEGARNLLAEYLKQKEMNHKVKTGDVPIVPLPFR